MRPGKIDLAEAVVAVTGAGRGIGRATAGAFTASGATVCLGDLDGERASFAADELGDRAHPFRVDVRSRESFAEFLLSIEHTVGPVDVLVNNAGVMPTGSFLDESDATTEAVLAVNLAGPLHGMRLALPGMIERGRGHVVNVSSMLGKIEVPGLASYVASKHGLVGLAAGVRSELTGTGVTVTTVLPSVVNTELSSGIPLPWPLARLVRVEPEDVAAAILASCTSRPGELAVPRWLSIFPALRPFIPDPVESLVRRLLGDDRALGAEELDSRSGYAERIARQARGES